MPIAPIFSAGGGVDLLFFSASETLVNAADGIPMPASPIIDLSVGDQLQFFACYTVPAPAQGLAVGLAIQGTSIVDVINLYTGVTGDDGAPSIIFATGLLTLANADMIYSTQATAFSNFDTVPLFPAIVNRNTQGAAINPAALQLTLTAQGNNAACFPVTVLNVTLLKLFSNS